LFIWLYRRCPRILDAITIVKHATVVRWHRDGFCRLMAVEIPVAGGPPAHRPRSARPDRQNEP
jgi:hypothetical protein